MRWFDAYLGMAISGAPSALAVLVAAAAALGLAHGSVTIAAQQSQTTVCHATGTGSFRPVSVAAPAVPAHMKHGDGVVGGDVPDRAGFKFDSACRAVPAHPDGTPCNDGHAGTADSCNPATGPVNTPIDVDDGDACTIDVCDGSGISHVPDGAGGDLDLIPDCLDACPAFYACEASHDRDADGILDCADTCPDSSGGDGDMDADGVTDCSDVCPFVDDAVRAVDQDGDGVVDCEDSYHMDPCRAEPANGACQPISDADGDGLPSCFDPGPNDPANAWLGGSFFRAGGGGLPAASSSGDPSAVLLSLAVLAYHRFRSRHPIR